MTDQPKWTPGPWAVERNKRTWGWVDVVGPSLGVGGPTQATDLTLADEVKRIAEAHLIAAAPDLYAALEAIRDNLEAIRDNEVVRAICPSPLWGKMADAMIKARGETK